MKEYGSDNTLLRALEHTASTHAIWIELFLAFQLQSSSKIRFGEYSSLQRAFLYQAQE